jgi:hypothetical protein
MLRLPLGSEKLYILLTCRPVILNEVLASVLRGVPEFILVEPSTGFADVVITTRDDAATLFDDLGVYPKPTKLIITIDRQQNTLYVRSMFKENVGIEMLPGEISLLLELLNREVAKQRLRLLNGRSA